MNAIQRSLGNLAPKPSGGYQPPTGPGAPVADITRIVSNIIGIITVIAGVAFIFYFLIGAINWITSGGDTNKAQAARTMIINALLGLVITVIAYPVILVISNLLGIPLKDPGELFQQLIFQSP